MRCITRNYICWSHREVVGTTAHSNSLLLLSSKCKLDVIRTLSVYLLLFCANLQEQQEEKRLVWCSSLFFWVFFFFTHSLFIFLKIFFLSLPEDSLRLFSSYLFLSEHFVLLNFCEVSCALCLRGIPEVQQAVMRMNSWHCGFWMWLMTLVTSYPFYQDIHT